MPYESATFDKALAINSMQVWPDAVAGLAGFVDAHVVDVGEEFCVLATNPRERNEAAI